MLTSNIAGVENGVNKETTFHDNICFCFVCSTGMSANLTMVKCQHLITVSQANGCECPGPETLPLEARCHTFQLLIGEPVQCGPRHTCR